MSETITAVVLTLNEERHLPDCLKSLRPVTSDVIVLDSGSTDRTVNVALAAGARVEHRAFNGWASQRNAALDLVECAGWILFLDADERLTVEGAREILKRVTQSGDEVAAFWLPRRNVFFGKQLKGGGWWPDHQARLLRTGRARFDEARQVHEFAIIDGESERLMEPLIHINYESRREFIRKQREYTLRRVRSSASVECPRRRAYVSGPTREFRRRFVALAGYRDGVTGLFLAAVLSFEEARACWLLRRRAG